MGCGQSSEAVGKVKSDIDQELEIASHQSKLKFKILLLGSGESGKSTVLKQLKMVHRISLTPQELKDYTYSLKRNALESMLVLVDKAEECGFPIEDQDLLAKADTLRKLGKTAADELITHQVAVAIAELWKADCIKKTFDRKNEFWILDSCDYYFDNIERFIEDDFEPSEEDMVMARVLTTGIITTEIAVPPLQFTVVDVGGQRNERRKWMHVFDDVQAIIFVVNLAGYNGVLYEDQSTNRMEECMNLFRTTVNNALFSATPVFLLFNKKDLFEKMIATVPITVCPCFTEYSGPQETMACLDFITTKFKAAVQVGGDDRIQVFNIAARFKRDVKTTWDDLVSSIRKRNAKQIDVALKALVK